jgi:hypothetical protein
MLTHHRAPAPPHVPAAPPCHMLGGPAPCQLYPAGGGSISAGAPGAPNAPGGMPLGAPPGAAAPAVSDAAPLVRTMPSTTDLTCPSTSTSEGSWLSSPATALLSRCRRRA